MTSEDKNNGPGFTRRESEVMDVLYQLEKASAREVWRALGETRSYSTVRTLLTILEEKGHVSHRKEGVSYIYFPSIARDEAASNAISRLLDTFFKGSVAGAVSSFLGEQGDKLSTEELNRISAMIDSLKEKDDE